MKDKKTIIDLLESAAAMNSELPAVVSEEGVLTFNQVAERSYQIAGFIRAELKDEYIIICQKRSHAMILNLLGVLKSGNTYVPVDPTTPIKRIDQIIGQVQPALIITDQKYQDKFSHYDHVISSEQLIVNSEKLPLKPLRFKPAAKSVAYLIFTSGSGGVPKGVPISHGSLWNKIANFNPQLSFTTAHRCMLLASIAFDASIGQMFLPLTTGGSLHLIDFEKQKDPTLLWEYIREYKINVLYTIPSLMEAMLETPLNIGLVHFDYILLGAEPFHTSLFERIMNRLNVEVVVNMYGPTEITVNATMFVTSGHQAIEGRLMPIGHALPGYVVNILDEQQQVLKQGQKGEIAITGDGLSPGYFNAPDLTARKFVYIDMNGRKRRSYLTGDIGVLNERGELDFIGRKDRQGKINGHRIELEEIESCLQNHPCSIKLSDRSISCLSNNIPVALSSF